WTGAPRGDVKEPLGALRSAISHRADGIAVSILDEAKFAPEAARAARMGIPLIAFNVGASLGSRRYAYVGEDPHMSGASVGAEIARLTPSGSVIFFPPDPSPTCPHPR